MISLYFNTMKFKDLAYAKAFKSNKCKTYKTQTWKTVKPPW